MFSMLKYNYFVHELTDFYFIISQKLSRNIKNKFSGKILNKKSHFIFPIKLSKQPIETCKRRLNLPIK